MKSFDFGSKYWVFRTWIIRSGQIFVCCYILRIYNMIQKFVQKGSSIPHPRIWGIYILSQLLHYSFDSLKRPFKYYEYYEYSTYKYFGHISEYFEYFRTGDIK